jgi:DNA invertase Pin-like site-specific DNA recombinase
MQGDSQRRQFDAALNYAREKGLELDEELTFHDLGVSGFRGANANTGKLKAFRRAVEDERVEAGSYLLVEDFDRLSRMNPWDAMPVFQEIINAGITVVTLKDREVWHRDALRANPLLLMKSYLRCGTATKRA